MTPRLHHETRVSIVTDFFGQPILNSPYGYPDRHWELDDGGQPTANVLAERRRADFVTPIPAPKKRGKKKSEQEEIVFGEASGISSDRQRYEKTAQTINALRQRVDAWRKVPNPDHWGVTPETARLLQHWRSHDFSDIRPFFCQVEAVETAIWLSEVAPQRPADRRTFIDYLDDANEASNPGLARLALKLATGAGKTTVMAMLIAWQTINAVRRPNRKNFTRGFLVVAPGITIKDRLRVLQPNDPDSYYKSRELVPGDMLADLNKAAIVITNYHAFKLRETTDVSRGTRNAIEGWRGESMQTTETDGQMLKRVMPELLGLKHIVVLNDEAHHCYREKPGESDEDKLKGDDKAEADTNAKAARLWINGLEAVQRQLGVRRIFDLSATPFFLRGSGYAEGTLFPWTMSDFSLMDAIECGIVKLPRVPVADNNVIKRDDMPMFRVLWDHIGKDMPKGNRKSTKNLDPKDLPTPLFTALEALYGHYEKTFDAWEQAGSNVPPCFIVVCNNTATSKLVYDYLAGYEQENDDGSTRHIPGQFELFRNHDEHGNPLADSGGKPRTLLIDSEQLESGDALDANFRNMASEEIEQFRKEIIERSGNQAEAERIIADDAAVLREVMNTVGKPDKLGSGIRCVVSVSMLTEGWDANTVTHVLGVRAFGTQLLCEQVIGRALRRQSYRLNDDGLFDVEYADVLGIPFDFTAKPVPAPVKPPPPTVRVEAVRPERDPLEITFPRVQGYRTELPNERLDAEFNDDSTFILTPEYIGPSNTENQGIVGEGANLTLEHTGSQRYSALVMKLAVKVAESKFRDGDGRVKSHLVMQLKPIVRRWLDHHLVCKGGTYAAQMLFPQMAEIAANRIDDAITRRFEGDHRLLAVLDPYNPTGTTASVSFNTSKTERWDTKGSGESSGGGPKCHLNWVILDSDWEAEFCRVAEAHPRVVAYVKNHNLGLEVPYRYGPDSRRYRPDFILRVDAPGNGHGPDNFLNLIVEIKGYRGEDAKEKANTMKTRWVPGVNNLGTLGRWAFAEFCDPWSMQSDFAEAIESEFKKMIAAQAPADPH